VMELTLNSFRFTAEGFLLPWGSWLYRSLKQLMKSSVILSAKRQHWGLMKQAVNQRPILSAIPLIARIHRSNKG
jgi:hypothetical protein